jgi:hypothetical protein
MRDPLTVAPEEYLTVPDAPAVFLLWAAEGRPMLSRTAKLRRRLGRLLKERETPGRLLNLRGIATRIDYWLTGSQLESSILFYQLARLHYPDEYLRLTKLKPPSFVKLTLTNAFPRTQINNRLGGRSLAYGPFRSRAAAEKFEQALLDLFQIRRCQENLEPTPEHPGCIYGEMNLCLRPCQQIVTIEEYASEVKRVEQFLASAGKSMLDSMAAQRDRASEEMNFEEAARQHKRIQKVQDVLGLRDELTAPGGRLSGVAVLPSHLEETVELQPMIDGCFGEPRGFSLIARDGMNTSMEVRLRETAVFEAASCKPEEHLALLVRWFFSSWRDGEWIALENGHVPYRRLANAIARVAKGHRETLQPN